MKKELIKHKRNGAKYLFSNDGGFLSNKNLSPCKICGTVPTWIEWDNFDGFFTVKINCNEGYDVLHQSCGAGYSLRLAKKNAYQEYMRRNK